MATAACTLRFQLPSHLDADSSFFDKKSLSLSLGVQGVWVDDRGPAWSENQEIFEGTLVTTLFPFIAHSQIHGDMRADSIRLSHSLSRQS